MQVLARLDFCLFFFFNDTATTEIYTLSLHDALPIYQTAEDRLARRRGPFRRAAAGRRHAEQLRKLDRKSTRLNSSHANISYAVFCLKKKKNTNRRHIDTLCATCTTQPQCPPSRPRPP